MKIACFMRTMCCICMIISMCFVDNSQNAMVLTFFFGLSMCFFQAAIEQHKAEAKRQARLDNDLYERSAE